MRKERLPAAEAASYNHRRKLIAELHRDFSRNGRRRRQQQHLRYQIYAFLFSCTFGLLKRLFDSFVASAALLLLSPVLIPAWVLARSFKGGITSQERLGRWATIFPQYLFDWGEMPHWWFTRSARLTMLPSLLNVTAGHMSLIGPRALSPEEVSADSRAASRRFNLRPGFVCLWWIRHRVKMAYHSEAALDTEYVDTQSFWGDMGIALRAIPASLASDRTPQAPERLTLLRIPIDNLTTREANETIVQLAQQQTPRQVCFVNAHCVNIALKNTEYTELLDRASLVLADGRGIRLAASLSNQHIRENVNGTDLLPYLCESLRTQPIGVYLLGGKPGVAEEAAAKLKESYGGLRICGYRDGYFTSEEEPQIITTIRDSGARVLLVAMGVPQQELWISRNLAALGVGVAIGVGGLLDFYSGRIPRAPAWMRELGLEWLYRLRQEPRRMWKRYLMGNFIFLCHVARERISSANAQRPELSQ